MTTLIMMAIAPSLTPYRRAISRVETRPAGRVVPRAPNLVAMVRPQIGFGSYTRHHP
jgi:hypothetical protein